MKKLKMPDFRNLDMQKAPPHRAAFYDIYASGKDAPQGTAGIAFDDGSVVVQTCTVDPFRLAHKFGSEWYELANIRRDDPEMRKLAEAGQIRDHHSRGPSKAELMRRGFEEKAREYHEERRAEAVERKRLADEQAARARQDWIAHSR